MGSLGAGLATIMAGIVFIGRLSASGRKVVGVLISFSILVFCQPAVDPPIGYRDPGNSPHRA
jgi:hypothetical protein